MTDARSRESTVPRPAPVLWSQLLLDAVVVLYASWTVVCHAVVIAGGNTHDLVAASAAGLVVIAGALLTFVIARRRGAAWARGLSLPRVFHGEAPTPEVGRERLLQLGLAVAVGGLVGLWWWKHDPLLQWAVAAVTLSLAYAMFVLRPEPPQLASNRSARWQGLVLWTLAALCFFLALYGHRWRNDDCYYINLAVGVADMPERPLLVSNDVHGPLPGAPRANNVFAPYRVHSFEALGGMLSFVTGVAAIEVIHLGFAAFFAALIPLAFARLFRLLDPQRWLWMVLAAMCIQLFEGSSGLGYGSQGIVRMFTGKSVMLSVGVPLLMAYGIGLGAHPTWGRMGLLAAAQIMAVGLSSTALWLAPVGAMLAVLVPLRFDRRAPRAVLMGLLSCGYVIAIALWVRSTMFGGGDGDAASTAAAATTITTTELSLRFDLLLSAFERMFEQPSVTEAYLVLLVAAIPLSRSVLGRRYLIVFTLALVLVLMNPYFANWLRHNVTGRYTGQRTMWLAPIAPAVALAFVAPIAEIGRRFARPLGIVVSLCALYAFFSSVPTRAAYSPDNGVEMHWPPGPKVPESAYELIAIIKRELPPRAYVLAPEIVSWYLPTVHHHPYPVLANAKYMSSPRKDELRRKRLLKWVSGGYKTMNKRQRVEFIAGLDRYAVSGVVLNRRALRTQGLAGALKAAGFRRAPGVPGLRFYRRAWDAPPLSIYE